MHLGHFVGNGTEGWYGTEGNASVIHIEAGHDDAYATIGQLVAYLNKAFVEELCFVNTYHVDVAGQQENARRGVDGCGEDGILVVADHFLIRVSGVDAGLEDFHALPGKLGASESAYEFFCLAREHRAAHHFYSAGAVHFPIKIICHKNLFFRTKIRKRFKNCKEMTVFFAWLE